MTHVWEQLLTKRPHSYICGYCGRDVSPEKGYYAKNQQTNQNDWSLYICHHCNKPTFFDELNRQTPGKKFGSDVASISDESVSALYDEARNCFTLSAFTAAGMCCRKLLMHIAVDKGAKTGLTFIDYVTHLETLGYTPPNSKEWVDEIRKLGNTANHEIVFLTKTEAENLISFIEMLLKFIYEFPAKIKK